MFMAACGSARVLPLGQRSGMSCQQGQFVATSRWSLQGIAQSVTKGDRQVLWMLPKTIGVKIGLCGDVRCMNRHSLARIERPFRAKRGCEQPQQNSRVIRSPRQQQRAIYQARRGRMPLAVFKLTTSSNLVGCMTGIPSALAPSNCSNAVSISRAFRAQVSAKGTEKAQAEALSFV